jgi:hypothetical protein
MKESRRFRVFVQNRKRSLTQSGLLALPSNIGVASVREFSIIPETNVALSYQLGSHVRIFGGYNVLSWNNVARPSDLKNEPRWLPAILPIIPNSPS